MERFVYPSYSIYQSYGNAFSHSHNVAPRPPSKQKQPGWKQSKTSRSSIPSPYRGPLSAPSPAPLPPPPSSPDYLDSYKRAQLKALLSQVSPGLAPRLRKASTKEVGTQVNPRVDAAVQCSLGSRQLQSLLGREPPPQQGRQLSPCPEEEAAAAAATEKPPTGREGGPPSQQQAQEPEGKEPLEPEKGAQEPAEAKGKLPGSGEGEESAQQLRDEEGDAAQKGAANAAASTTTEGKRAAFQFLEQKYGYFHCNDCKTRWESAYVWCISGTNKVYFKQLCRKCQKSFNPYKVEAIQCRICAKTRCSCPQKKRHIDLKRPHRQELCGRCKGKRLSCDNTYSFKYII
ncbi:ZAR1-like protein isoform X1 [Lacerta agilis]|uniref:ZAR1-like protein isoform X1 n=1 Tax=Lacerta agilis TaxID=80427 RepID=UPI0014191DA5|nr:ZAR1-like protein isoform X1 [Lacerta agilis]